MHKLAEIYHPITGTPFRQDDTYCEITPCDALKPYIRCFWGSVKPVEAAVSIMPDAPSELPYEGAKPMLMVTDIEDREFLKKFSFICLLSLDVYVKKMIIEKLVDTLAQPKEKE